MTDYVMKNIKYICVREEDAIKYLAPEILHAFRSMVGVIESSRVKNGIPPLRVAITDLRDE